MRALALAATLLLVPAMARGFVYVEHSYLTDRACRAALEQLAPTVGPDAPLARRARYLALALACPTPWRAPYCADGEKQAESWLSRPDGPPAESGDHPATLGDLSALGDHVSRLGPVRGLERAGTEGLVGTVYGWLAQPPGDIGGIVGDVAEEVCRGEPAVPWARLDADVDAALAAADAGFADLPAHLMDPLRRGPITLGPTDPDVLFTFDNPHYLDLNLRNHDHFGRAAHAAWLGLHAAAVAAGRRPCAETIGLDADALEDLADDGAAAFAAVPWDDLPTADRHRRGCALLGSLVAARLRLWAAAADPALVAPVRDVVGRLDAARPDDPLLTHAAAALAGLTLEGMGLHFLQDALAGGHLRTDRNARGLGETRYAHDADNRRGVEAAVTTRAGTYRLVAFGDSTLVGDAGDAPARCDAATPDAAVSACLLRHQRGVVVAVGAASLVDWALGGRFYAERAPAEPGCATLTGAERFACLHLPTAPPVPTGDLVAAPPAQTLERGALPLPPPPFRYESVVAAYSLDASGGPPQVGGRLVLLSELGAWANWMTSYDIGFQATLGAAPQYVSEWAYRFHWRWAARFVVHAAPIVYGGLEDFDHGVEAFTGLAPSAGMTLLPEGWIKAPFQFDISWRMPLRLGDTVDGWFGDAVRVEAHWLELSLGLAFM